MPTEFRVRWQRERRGMSTRIYQTWDAAYKRYCTIACWDDIKEDTKYEDMPDLEYVVLESREVPEWTEHSFQPEVTDYYRERTRKAVLAKYPKVDEPDRAELPF